MSEQKLAPIYVIKKKINHGGHHGGAWKVAFADFVTAMMALFIVLWLLNTSQDVKDAVAGYFKDPSGNGRMAGSSQAGSGESLQIQRDNMDELKDKLEQLMKETPELTELKDQVSMTVTGEGLRVELMETEKGFFFESGSPKPSHNGEDFLTKLAAEVAKLENKVVIEGHTDAKAFASVKGYSNWELSTDRGNAARRIMQDAGLKPDQVTQVRGFAAQNLRVPENPEDPSNRRISVIIQYRAPETSDAEKSIQQKAAEAKVKEDSAHGKKDEHGQKDAHAKEDHSKKADHGKKEDHGKEDTHGKKKDENAKKDSHAKPDEHGKKEAPKPDAKKTEASKPSPTAKADKKGDDKKGIEVKTEKLPPRPKNNKADKKKKPAEGGGHGH
jgi:chemotaxis protein MotB